MSSRARVHLSRSAGRPWRGGQPDRPVEGRPAHHPAEREVLLAVAGLPDPLAGLVPVVRQPVDHAAQRDPAAVTQLEPVLVGEVEAVDRLAVDVHLPLVRGAVADPHRLRSAISLPVVQRLLRQIRGAVHPVHDVERTALAAHLLLDAVPQPAGERRRLLGEAHPEQCVDRERPVADPGVPVVPVALATDLLGQAGGGSGDQRPGRGVGHQLQRDRRPLQGLPPPSGVRRLSQPAAPEARRLLEQPVELRVRDLLRRPARRGLQHHPTLLPGPQLERDAHVARVGPAYRGEPFVALIPHRVQGQRQGRVDEHHAVLGDMRLVRLAPVVESWRDVRLEADPTAHAAHQPDQPVVVGRLPTRRRHEVQQLPDAVLGHEPRDQDRRVGQVQLLDHVVLGQPDGSGSDRPCLRPAASRRRSASRTAGSRTSRSSRRSRQERQSAGPRSGRALRWVGSPAWLAPTCVARRRSASETAMLPPGQTPPLRAAITSSQRMSATPLIHSG